MKKIIIIIVVIGLATICGILGYSLGHRSAVKDQVRFDMSVNLGLYKLLEAGNTNAVASKLHFLVYMYSDDYDRYCSGETVTPSFAKTLADAREIAAQERSRAVTSTTK